MQKNNNKTTVALHLLRFSDRMLMAKSYYELKYFRSVETANRRRPLAEHWHGQRDKLQELPTKLQISIICHWADKTYGPKTSEELLIREKVQQVENRSQELASRMPSYHAPSRNALSVVMGELVC